MDKWSILAGLRFALASIVAFNHLPEYAPLGIWSFVPRFGAFEAILGFLLISGYSISVSYLKEPARFLIRRLWRLYPIYLASIVIGIIASVTMSHESLPSLGVLLLNALFLNQLLTSTSFISPAWSLSLEFWLYCLAPFLIVISQGRLRAVIYVSFASYLIYTACETLFRMPYHAGVGYGGNLLFLSFIWICGLRLARKSEDTRQVMRDIRLLLAGHIALKTAIQFLWRVKHHSIGEFFSHDSVDCLMQSATLCAVCHIFSRYVVAPVGGARRSRLLRIMGDISYPLYLVHIPVYMMLSKTPLKGPLVFFAVAVAVSAALYGLLDVYSRKRHLQIAAA